jgi:hypothetical protein
LTLVSTSARTPAMAAFMALIGACGLFAYPLTAHAARFRFNDSGMDRCVAADGQLITECNGTGQDGEFGRDAMQNNASDGFAGFKWKAVCHSGDLAGTGSCAASPQPGDGTDEWACTLDNVTGLMWELKTETGLRSADRRFDHGGRPGDYPNVEVHVDEMNSARLCGRTDWREPTVTELQSIVHYGVEAGQPLIDAPFFPGPAPVFAYTTSSSFGGRFLNVSFFTGTVESHGSDDALPLRLVSGVGADEDRRFVAIGNGSQLYDRWARSIWRRCSEGQTWDGTACVGTPLTFTWNGALAYAQSLGGGWRLPNAKEVLRFPPSSACSFRWTSTPDARDTSLAYTGYTLGPSQLWQREVGSLLCVTLVRDLR